MADSTLSIGYVELLRETGKYLGYGRDTANYTANQTADADFIVQSGYRQFIAPPVLEGEHGQHTWSFLAPDASLSITASNEDYNAPDDFGGLVGDMFLSTASIYNVPIKQVPVNQVMTFRSRNANVSYSNRPEKVAVRVRPGFDGTIGDRFEFMFWPKPDAAYTVTYHYNVLVGKMSASAPYPLGGMQHGDLLLQSCLATAEARRNEERGVQWQLFMERLRASIEFDRSTNAPQNYGIMHDPSTGDDNIHRRFKNTSLVTVDTS